MKNSLKLAAILCAVAVPTFGADYISQIASIAYTTNADGIRAKTVDLPGISGDLAQIEIDVPAAGVTGKVAVYVTTEMGNIINVYTNDALAADAESRPVFAAHNDAGVAGTDLWRLPMHYDKLTFSVTNVGARVTNITWRLRAKWEK